MIVSRHYNRNKGNRKRTKRNPDAELDAILNARTIEPSAPSLRGIGIVSARKVAPATRRKYVKRNAGYWNGTRVVVSDNAPYWETLNDARMRTKAKVRKVEQGKVNVQTNADIALMAKMGTIHDPNEN